MQGSGDYGNNHFAAYQEEPAGGQPHAMRSGLPPLRNMTGLEEGGSGGFSNDGSFMAHYQAMEAAQSAEQYGGYGASSSARGWQTDNSMQSYELPGHNYTAGAQHGGASAAGRGEEEAYDLDGTTYYVPPDVENAGRSMHCPPPPPPPPLSAELTSAAIGAAAAAGARSEAWSEGFGHGRMRSDDERFPPRRRDQWSEGDRESGGRHRRDRPYSRGMRDAESPRGRDGDWRRDRERDFDRRRGRRRGEPGRTASDSADAGHPSSSAYRDRGSSRRDSAAQRYDSAEQGDAAASHGAGNTAWNAAYAASGGAYDASGSYPDTYAAGAQSGGAHEGAATAEEPAEPLDPEAAALAAVAAAEAAAQAAAHAKYYAIQQCPYEADEHPVYHNVAQVCGAVVAAPPACSAPFHAATGWCGAVEGYAFKTGDAGLGYYADRPLHQRAMMEAAKKKVTTLRASKSIVKVARRGSGAAAEARKKKKEEEEKAKPFYLREMEKYEKMACSGSHTDRPLVK